MNALGAAPAVLVQVTGGPDMTIRDAAEAVGLLRGRIREDCHLVVGTASSAALEQAAEVTVLGTGLTLPRHEGHAFNADRYDWGRRMALAATSRAKESTVQSIQGVET
jgi:cell division GTPase FtsZ